MWENLFNIPMIVNDVTFAELSLRLLKVISLDR